MRRGFVVAAMAWFMVGCSFSPYDSSSTFSCKAPKGVSCASMSGIYANAQQKNLPGMKAADEDGAKTESAASGAVALPVTPAVVPQGILTPVLSSGTPIRTPVRVLRVWFAPWEDAEGDLYDQFYAYLPLDMGRWVIEHNQQNLMEAYRSVHPPETALSSPKSKPEARKASIPLPRSAAELLKEIDGPGRQASPAVSVSSAGRV